MRDVDACNKIINKICDMSHNQGIIFEYIKN